MEENQLDLLKEALRTYKEKWEDARDGLFKTEDNIRIHVQYESLIYLAQWIINSINGGLDKSHATNICNILRKE